MSSVWIVMGDIAGAAESDPMSIVVTEVLNEAIQEVQRLVDARTPLDDIWAYHCEDVVDVHLVKEGEPDGVTIVTDLVPRSPREE